MQVALDRAGFSPGLIDGCWGPKTRLALREFQRARGLRESGSLDEQTRAALGVGSLPALIDYTITPADVAAVGPVPSDWNAKARLDRLPYESLSALLAERGHCTRAALRRFNPGRDLDRLRPGDAIRLPHVGEAGQTPRAQRLLVDFAAKTVRAVDDAERTLALFHCSIARQRAHLPRGHAAVAEIVLDPEYHFDPAKWPEVKSVNRKLTIPPGPRNPVGLAWIGLDLPGYGIHGTPQPELIGKTGSHGCIRLTNWDARRLARLVRVGTPVRFASASPL